MNDEADLRCRLEEADALYRRGAFMEALAGYQAALALAPRHVGALYFAALSLVGLGRNAEAVPFLRQSVALAPRVAQLHADLGAVLSMLEPSDEALASLNRALELDPNHASALANRGKVIMRRGDTAAGLADCERALALAPEHLVALTNRGVARLDLGQVAEALADFDRVLRFTPDDPQAIHNRGAAFLRLRRFDEALTDCARVVRMLPGWARGWQYMAQAQAGLRRFEAALESALRALKHAPDDAETLNDVGHLLRELKRPLEALDYLDRCLAVQPGHARAHYNKAAALLDLKRFPEAAAGFARVPQGRDSPTDTAGYLLQARTHHCDWTGLDALRAEIVAQAREGKRASHPFPFLAVSGDPAEELAVARGFMTDRFPPDAAPLCGGAHVPGDRIRLGYLSADLHAHATGWLMAELFELHDRKRFHVTAFSFGPETGDDMRARLRAGFDAFEEIGALSDAEAAALIHARRIDILVDLKGITADGRPGILARRPAPVQVSYLGYPGTLGMPYLDYIVADPVLIGPDEYACYAEKVVTLPDSYQVNDRRRAVAAETPGRAALGLPEQGLVFCCFNNNYKIMPDVFATWMRLLHAVEGSVLWLIEDTDAAAASLRAAAMAAGVAAERLVFAPRVPMPRHLARQRRADLFLDTLPYNAHTTASDALWVGLPVLTCKGRNFAGRVAASLLRAVGMPELVTHSLGDYEALARRLAADPLLLGSIRAKLADNLPRVPLFNTPRFCGHLEAAYVAMVDRSRRGEVPAPLEIRPIDP